MRQDKIMQGEDGVRQGWGKTKPCGAGTKTPSFGLALPHCHPYLLSIRFTFVYFGPLQSILVYFGSFGLFSKLLFKRVQDMDSKSFKQWTLRIFSSLYYYIKSFPAMDSKLFKLWTLTLHILLLQNCFNLIYTTI